MPANNTELQIGPLRFTHVVQKISVQERKSIGIMETARTGRNFISDSGESEHKAQIRLLFTGLDEINGGIGKDLGTSGLRALIALFKCCPIISVKNNYITNSWKQIDQIYDTENYDKMRKYTDQVTQVNESIQTLSTSLIGTKELIATTDFLSAITTDLNNAMSANPILAQPKFIQNTRALGEMGFGEAVDPIQFFKKSRVYSQYAPVALEQIQLENVPDIPFAIQVTLSIARIDAGVVSEDDILYYQGDLSRTHKVESPSEAHWLKIWIEKMLANDHVPDLTEEDFSLAEFNWYGETAVGSPLTTNSEKFVLHLTTSNVETQSILTGESASIRHKFAYNKLLGKLVAFPQHMGSTGRFMALDIVFNNQKDYTAYRKFCEFKESSDIIIKSKARLDRVTGWHIKTPISKLLGAKRSVANTEQERPWEGIYVPVSIFTESGDQPDMINCRMDLLENNMDFFSDNQILLSQGGTDYDKLKAYYDQMIKKEFLFRDKLISNRTAAIQEIIGQENSGNYEMYQLFWPIERQILKFNVEGRFGVFNADTLRATFLSKHFDKNEELVVALQGCKLATGAVRLGNRKITWIDKVSSTVPIIWASIGGIDFSDPEIARVNSIVFRMVSSGKFISLIDIPGFTNNPDFKHIPGRIEAERSGLYREIANAITASFLGDREGTVITTSLSGRVLQLIANNKWPLTQEFSDAMFKVLAERKPRPQLLPYVYSVDGVYSGFYKLISKYMLQRDSTAAADELQKEERAEILMQTKNQNRSSMYPDLILPTYEQLYGPDRWEEFAPTLDDLGIESYGIDPNFSPDKVPAVQSDDIISPAAWFYISRRKQGDVGLRAIAKKAVDSTNAASPNFSLSMPFNTNEIADIQQLINSDGIPDYGTRGMKTGKCLSEIIEDSAKKSRNNPSGHREDSVTLTVKYGEGFLSDPTKGNVKLYIHHINNISIPTELSIPGLGAIIYRIEKEKNLLDSITANLARVDADESLVTPLDKEVRFQRHLNKNNEAMVKSSIDQIPDDQYSPERFFPAAKVYLIDRRGTDLVADDTLFSVTSIISIDITQDKQDPPLAVIKLADPLYNLQDDYFDNSNIARVEEKDKRILNSLRAPDSDSYLKRFKLVQGRAIQIRLGYSSMAYNLPIVFTGRITEIVPGDQLTIVAQGWKAELVNRQVNFYNDDAKNWGARDLAIQAITAANPEGFGDFYPEHDAQFILSNINQADVTDMLERVIQNYNDIDLEGVGARPITNQFTNWIAQAVTLRSSDKLYKGFDTRLKNIWYPDTAMYTNILGIRSKLGIMPSFLNDSWIVPLQSSWDVLQEASRHAWNCIVDVVPYDGQATIFMGHPDQPFYYTRGTSFSRSRYNKYKNLRNKNVGKDMTALIEGFFDSKYFNTPADIFAIGNIANRTGNDVVLRQARGLEDIPSLQAFVTLASDDLGSITKANIRKSGLPSAKLQELIDRGMYDYTCAYLFSWFFGIPKDYLLNNWPNINRDLFEMLSRNIDLSDLRTGVSQNIAQLGTIQGYFDIPTHVNSLIQQAKRFNEIAIQRSRTQVSSTFLISFRQEIQDSGFVLEEIVNRINSILGKDRNITNRAKLISDPLKIALQAVAQNKIINKDLINIAFDNLRNALLTYIDSLRQLVTGLPTIRSSNDDSFSVLKKLHINLETNIGDAVIHNIDTFKAFVYYFALYALSEPAAIVIASGIEEKSVPKLAPNMKVFRVHHFADDDHNIINNNIIATTREMWNTVVIEHPSAKSAEALIPSKEELYTQGRLNVGANWVYYPKQEVTGVIGLQFHPGLTLANKKIKVFTELNCQSPELAAKLACGHLAEGIRKMYRGNLLMLGKHIKPHDRIVIADKYTRMTGPIEVESVIHHWNTEQGYITNIIPNAICDANPGAAIFQTAMLEATFQTVFNTLEYVSDALMWMTIIATLGAATPLAAGEFSAFQGTSALLKRLLTQRGKFLSNTIKIYKKGIIRVGRKAGIGLRGLGRTGHRLDLIRYAYKDYAGPALSLLKNEVSIAGLEYINHVLMKMNVIPGFMENSGDVEQLPVILSPLVYNNTAYTAGLEAEDSIWAIAMFGFFYSMKTMQAGVARFFDDIFESPGGI